MTDRFLSIFFQSRRNQWIDFNIAYFLNEVSLAKNLKRYRMVRDKADGKE